MIMTQTLEHKDSCIEIYILKNSKYTITIKMVITHAYKLFKRYPNCLKYAPTYIQSIHNAKSLTSTLPFVTFSIFIILSYAIIVEHKGDLFF